MSGQYDAILVVGFGGPEKREDVIPFLENVLRGRNVPRERMLAVAEHYYHFGGVSPINQQVRDLLAVLRPELSAHGVDLPVYWGNRNWTPLLPDALQEMADAGVRRALALVLSAYSSYSSCRQYREDIERARQSVQGTAPQVDKVRVFYNHPGFIEASAERVQAAIDQMPADARETLHIAYTAHSIPSSLASSCDYERQLAETCRLTSLAVGVPAERWKLVYQSRSGRPQDPWLEPDICDHLEWLAAQGVRQVVIMPIGFLSDHIEILYDLDEEAQARCEELNLQMVRAASVGTHPKFVAMLRELIQERLDERHPRRSIGQYGPNHDICPLDCCPAPARPTPGTTARSQTS